MGVGPSSREKECGGGRKKDKGGKTVTRGSGPAKGKASKKRGERGIKSLRDSTTQEEGRGG